MTKTKAKILIVEDEKSLNDAYALILSRDYIVETAFDGKTGVDLLDTFKPDIVLLDLRMPKLDGIGFLKEAKKRSVLTNVKIVVFSNFDVQQEIDEAFELGAHRYMLKAWASPRELIGLIEDILSDTVPKASR